MPRFSVAAFLLVAVCPLTLWRGSICAQAPAPVASATPAASDLKTVSGQIYKNARVARIEPDGVTYFFAGGAVKIPFIDLPEEMRRKYGYDPKKAADFAAADNAAQEAEWHAANPTMEELRARAEQEARQRPSTPAPDEFSGSLGWGELDAAKRREIIAAKDLIALYDENELSADNICKGRVGKIRGTVTDISRDMLGVPYVMLDHGVRCAFPRGDEDQLRNLRNGQAVVIIGQIHGKTIGCVSMYKCTLF